MADEVSYLTNGSRWVTPADLAQAPRENVLSDTERVEARIWLAAHIATIEVLMRIYLSKLVTQGNLISTLSTVIGRKVSSKSLSSLHGADGALFWLVVTAARTVSLLGIKDCSDWLAVHLLDDVPCPQLGSVSSTTTTTTTTTTLTSDSLDQTADRFLRGLAMANLLALTLHFYRPESAPVEGKSSLMSRAMLGGHCSQSTSVGLQRAL
ncbi:hypothetical protein PHET_04434 [Paragonimus heterotremus]|uniref:Uncharacterized protein n=1 Tax=Paragonimus heterotremus TaxID=100268 RepID=A0A8J4TCA8_9TREM|nr:hypothetical protein PHET_04434 [Paragonimus heterotremus]